MCVTYISTEKVPEYALPYLFNGDVGDMDEEDLKMVKAFEEEMLDYAKSLLPYSEFGGIDYSLSDEEEESFFTRNPAFGLPCGVRHVDVYVIINNPI